jgi:hypothetical protein
MIHSARPLPWRRRDPYSKVSDTDLEPGSSRRLEHALRRGYVGGRVPVSIVSHKPRFRANEVAPW